MLCDVIRGNSDNTRTNQNTYCYAQHSKLRTAHLHKHYSSWATQINILIWNIKWRNGGYAALGAHQHTLTVFKNAFLLQNFRLYYAENANCKKLMIIKSSSRRQGIRPRLPLNNWGFRPQTPILLFPLTIKLCRVHSGVETFFEQGDRKYKFRFAKKWPIIASTSNLNGNRVLHIFWSFNLNGGSGSEAPADGGKAAAWLF